MVARTDADLYKATVRINITYQCCPGRLKRKRGLFLEEVEAECALSLVGSGLMLEVAAGFTTVQMLTIKLPFTFRTLYC